MPTAPARISLVRRIEWADTDAAGVYHWSTVFRLVEAAEAVLHDRLGIREHTFGRTPRVHVSCDFHRELAFYDAVRTELRVAEVGRTSVRYAFSLFPEGGGEPPAGGGDGPSAEGGGEPAAGIGVEPAAGRGDEPAAGRGDGPAAGRGVEPAAEGEVVGVHVTGAPGGGPDPWPPEIRERLLEGGDQGRVEGV